MKRNPSYTLRILAGVPYLLPFGQMIADRKRGIRINETGIYLWELLETERSMEELLTLCAAHYGTDTAVIRKDLETFVRTLSVYGILESAEDVSLPSSAPALSLEIGGLSVKLWGPKEAFSPLFAPFAADPLGRTDLKIFVREGMPDLLSNGTVLLRNRQLTVMEQAKQYILLFPATKQILEAHLSKDGSQAVFYCISPYTDSFREELFHAIRLVWLYLAQRHHIVALHSASVLYRGRAWLFSGPSGTGKSTHTNLWHRLLKVPILNGDLNLPAFQEDNPMIYGLPWCGTSGISDPGTYPLGGIILLKQGETDRVEELSSDLKQLLLLQRLISPSWSDKLFEENLRCVNRLTAHVPVCRLHCTMKESAVAVMRSYIDDYLDLGQPLDS
ncbi:MAG: PqqD family peptide modification chaperone [Lachnospiraceae bacterium]|nr:PqqD family peptide modification chaperone [Lachnospiraceae bacterium]